MFALSMGTEHRRMRYLFTRARTIGIVRTIGSKETSNAYLENYSGVDRGAFAWAGRRVPGVGRVPHGRRWFPRRRRWFSRRGGAWRRRLAWRRLGLWAWRAWAGSRTRGPVRRLLRRLRRRVLRCLRQLRPL